MGEAFSRFFPFKPLVESSSNSARTRLYLTALFFLQQVYWRFPEPTGR